MSEPIERIVASGLPMPAGYYSHATAWSGLVFVSGQLPQRADGTHEPQQSFEAQTRQALSNLMAVLAASDCGPEHVLRVTAYITGEENWTLFNRIYAEVFGSTKTARTVVPVERLHHGYLVEVDAIAARARGA